MVENWTKNDLEKSYEISSKRVNFEKISFAGGLKSEFNLKYNHVLSLMNFGRETNFAQLQEQGKK